MKLILILIALLSIGCKHKIDNNQHSENEILMEGTNNKSFVISCGSGCALVYNLKQIKKKSKLIIAEFDVTQYINEKVTDNYPDKVKYLLTDNEGYEIYIGDNLVTENSYGQLYLNLKIIGNETQSMNP
ncbi:hypothetical protein [Allomuricauda sp. NBRC 101325]|uniref:hypothetical protein n=1 Tax=Allomuricauda sp. NBRC 101325 TaxID=1113758 RepID=UPI0024A4EC4A|nr:hypothetical protein [Muricauda sp. NBRC 101325]GLU43610.1 hypothetical protein Musp01_12340 [Muricauda sp. NBRC 101325]